MVRLPAFQRQTRHRDHGQGRGRGYAPISCTVTTEEVFQDFIADPSDRDSYFRDISTFGGCTAGPAAGYANINYMEEHKVLDNVVKMGDYLMDGLKALEKKYEIIGDVRGKGLFCGLELVKNRDTKEPRFRSRGRSGRGRMHEAGRDHRQDQPLLPRAEQHSLPCPGTGSPPRASSTKC